MHNFIDLNLLLVNPLKKKKKKKKEEIGREWDLIAEGIVFPMI